MCRMFNRHSKRSTLICILIVVAVFILWSFNINSTKINKDNIEHLISDQKRNFRDDVVVNIKHKTEQQSGIDIGDTRNKDNKLKEVEVNMNVKYDQSLLEKEIQRVHYENYSIPKDETCIKRPPQCVVIGVYKCGTTELLDFMSMHPNIVIKRKETPYYFNEDDDMSKLEKQMPCSYSDQIPALKNAGYFHRMELPENLHNYNPDLKMILMIREPLSRMISHLQMNYFLKLGDSEKNQYQNVSEIPSMDDNLIDPDTGEIKIKQIEVKRSIYDGAMSRWLKFFSLNQILIIESKELIANPAKVVQKVEKFLGLRPFIKEDHFVYNEEKKFYCLKSKEHGSVCYGGDRGRAKQKEISDKTRAIMGNMYRPHTQAFLKMIGMHFDWNV